MEIYVAKNSGFCKGVEVAVNTALSIEGESVYVLGELIHNAEVVREIGERGIKTVDSLSKVPVGSTVIFRSHGVPKSFYDLCEKRGIRIIDCTCSFVRRTQTIVEQQSAEGKLIVIAGEREHPEVVGLVGWCSGEAIVIDNPDKIPAELAHREVCIVSQTTFSVEKLEKIIKNIQNLCEKTVAVFKTICYTTIERQRETERLAQNCEAMAVIGGLNSSNTNKLYETAKRYCENVFRLSNARDLDYSEIKKFKSVGIVAGASTPNGQTREVLLKMAENTEVKAANETAEEVITENAAVEEPAVVDEKAVEAIVKDEKVVEVAAKNEMEEVVAKIDNESKFRKGQIVSATISQATDDGLQILLPFSKKEIALSKDELDCENYSAEDYFDKIGESIDLLVVELKPSLKLSQKLIRVLKEEEELSAEIESGKEFNVVCTGTNKGGLVGQLGTFPVFIPAKEIRPGYVKDLTKYVGKTLRLRALEIRKSGKKEIIASQRVILVEEREARDAARAAREEEFFASIAVGDIVEGKVERATDFGAFVSVNGFDCLAHISDLAWTGAAAVKDVLELGKTYKFKVLKIDKENKKVSIGYKQLQPQPWELAEGKYAQGDIIHGKVVRIVPFGAFIEVEKGIDGLVHVSQICRERIETPAAVLTVGEEVDAKIINLDIAAKKMNLSIKAILPEPERKPREAKSGGEEKRKGPSRKYDDDISDWSEGSISIGTTLGDIFENAKKNK